MIAVLIWKKCNLVFIFHVYIDVIYCSKRIPLQRLQTPFYGVWHTGAWGGEAPMKKRYPDPRGLSVVK